jgi:hypothetical protein
MAQVSGAIWIESWLPFAYSFARTLHCCTRRTIDEAAGVWCWDEVKESDGLPQYRVDLLSRIPETSRLLEYCRRFKLEGCAKTSWMARTADHDASFPLRGHADFAAYSL